MESSASNGRSGLLPYICTAIDILEPLIPHLLDAREEFKTIVLEAKKHDLVRSCELARWSVGLSSFVKDVRAILEEMTIFKQIPNLNVHARGSLGGASLALISCCHIKDSLDRLIDFTTQQHFSIRSLPMLTEARTSLARCTMHIPSDPLTKR